MLFHLFAEIYTDILSCLVYWAHHDNAFLILRSGAIRFITCTSRLLKDPPKELKDEMDCEILPTELWRQIGERLTNPLDILRFRSTCRQWRSSLPSSTRFPLQVPTPPTCGESELENMAYFITEVNVYSAGWGYVTVAFEEVDQGGKFRPRYLVPNRRIFESSMISFMEYPDHPFKQLRHISKAYHLRLATPRGNSHKNRLQGKWKPSYTNFAKKAIILDSKGNNGNPSYARASDLIVVFCLNRGSMRGRLALLRLRGTPENWAWETDFCTQVFLDIATYRGQLCSIDKSGRIFLMDVNSLEMTQVAHPPPVHGLSWKELFESLGNLYLTDTYRMSRFGGRKSYRLCFKSKQWIELDGIAKQILDFVPLLFGRPELPEDEDFI